MIPRTRISAWCIAAALALVPCPALAASPPHACPILTSQAQVKSYIVTSEEQWASSVATNDASVVKRILADDFVWVLDGRVLDKLTAVREAAQGPGDFLSNNAEYVHVRFFGKTAVAQGKENWTKKGGRRGSFIWTDTWVERNGCWQIVNAQDTVLSPPSK
ncbi:MAG: DUF4440 domain-containing protein [Acidobacteriota bacterium]|nr:DUF4440 domain-containing protein [Acidobacteriota bacterium]